MKFTITTTFSILFTLSLFSQQFEINDLGNMQCGKHWEDVVFGICIGNNNSLIPFDLANDGTIELIASARTDGGLGNRGYWYILKHNANTGEYDKVHISNTYEDPIDKMVVFDLGDDGVKELLYVIKTNLYVVNLITLEEEVYTLPTLPTSGLGEVQQIIYADGDNDGVKEIVISDRNDLVFLNAETYTLEHAFAMHTGDFDIGQVDGDAALEIVFSFGLTLQVAADGTYVEEYDFRPEETTPQGQIRLSDTDQDGFEEAVVADRADLLMVYDINLNTLKYEFETNYGVGAFLMADINNDGMEEILYGNEESRGNLYCHDAQNGDMLWEVELLPSGTTGIAVADFDNDQQLEVVWGAGCFTTGADHLFFYQANNQNFEWESPHLDGPYYALEIEDVDQDGRQEIITLSLESNSGDRGGVLTIYDAITKEVEFHSSTNFFSSVWLGMYNLEIADYLNDGDLDIVVAAGRAYNGTIWVVDGDTHAIESDYTYTAQGGPDELYALEVIDIDGDGQEEFICGTDGKLHIINSFDYTVEWSSGNLSGPRPRGLLTGDIDGDGFSEIVLAKNTLYTFDNGTFTQQQSTTSGYLAIALHDWDDSGDLEIIAGTSSGRIRVFDGLSFSIIEEFQLEYNLIEGIAFADLNNDGEEEMIITQDGRMVAMAKNGDYLTSNILSSYMGAYDALVIKDYDNDGEIDIIVGTVNGILEIDPSCASCLWFDAELVGVDPTCGENNGAIIGTSEDETTVFSYGAITFQDALEDLPAANYSVMASNEMGCQKSLTLSLVQYDLISTLEVTDRSCVGEDDGEAVSEVTAGLMPITYDWSTGASTTMLQELAVGAYSLTITDSNNCEDVFFFEVEQSTIAADVVIEKPSCVETANGVASVDITQGLPPYQYFWDEEVGNAFNNALDSGMHTVIIIDQNGCETTQVFQMTEAELLIDVQALTASCNGQPDGSAEVIIEAGTPPFFTMWSGDAVGTNIASNLNPGTYYVTIDDGNFCVQTDSVVIIESVLELTSSVVQPLCANEATGSAVVFVTEGVEPITYQWNTGETVNSIGQLLEGEYFVLVRDSTGCQIVEQIVIDAPDPIAITFNVVDDNPLTSEPDGAVTAEVTGGVGPYFYNWGTGGTIAEINMLAAGSYTLTITDINECQVQDEVTVSILSDVTEVLAGFIEIYPNPCKSYLKIEEREAKRVERIRLIAADGQVVVEKSLAEQLNKSWQLDTRMLSSGTYILLLEIDGEFYQKQIVKI
ncbi:FG-GAP-like repeat-containing protein [Lewinella cohaerens]|uniref:FG-GAP-like repeat-containing protein n=1 Tax=Lewinella cohaerens TaxID=70995 RepID=UPI0003666F38|nr:FG-GAP-like repeat-containing protein [Lewinella cohaerens]